MPGLLQGVLRSDGVVSALLARGYSLAVGGRFRPTLEGVDLGRGLLLDLGAGPGHLTSWVAARDPARRVVAADLSLAMLRRAGRVLPRALPRVAADAMALPFLDGVFGAVLSVAALKFWPDRERGLLEMARVVGPGGRLIVVEVDREVDDARLDRFLRGIHLAVLANRSGRAFVRRQVFDRSLAATELEAMARRLLGAGEVARVGELPFLRLEAAVNHPSPPRR